MTLLISCNSMGEILDIIWELRNTGATIEQDGMLLGITAQPVTTEIEEIVKSTREKWNPDMVKRNRYDEAPRLSNYGDLKGLLGGTK